MNRNVTRIIGVLFLLTLLTSCATTPSAILSEPSCNAPCWRNISIGMSKDEVYSKLQNMKDIQTNSIEMGPTYKPFWQEGISWSFTGTVEKNGGIYFHDDKVVMMHFSEADNLPISAFIEKFGEPQQVWITRATLDGVMLDIRFMYLQQGTCFDHPPSLFSQYSDNYSISSGAKIRDVYYFDPAIASLDQLNVGCLSSIEAEKIQLWKGYGEYRVFERYK